MIVPAGDWTTLEPVDDLLWSFPAFTPFHLHSIAMDKSGQMPGGWMPGPDTDWESVIYTLAWTDLALLANSASWFLWGAAQWEGAASFNQGLLLVSRSLPKPSVTSVAARALPIAGAVVAAAATEELVTSMVPVVAGEALKPWWMPLPVYFALFG